jgi:hypothetical protein
LTLGIVILLIIGFFVGVFLLITIAMAIVLATGVLLAPLWIPVSTLILNSPRRYR